MHAKSVKK